MYASGRGTAKDEAEAVRWYRKGADAGNMEAMAGLAQMQLEGTGAAKDEAAATALMRKAADAGNAFAMTLLGAAMVKAGAFQRTRPRPRAGIVAALMPVTTQAPTGWDGHIIMGGAFPRMTWRP